MTEWHGYTASQTALKNYLEHHGIKGQRWGVRRYQNPDGTLTDAGRKRIKKTETKVSNMYNALIKMASKSAESAAKKGKFGKQKVFKYIAEENKRAKKEKLEKIGKMSYSEFKNSVKKIDY